MSLFTNPVTLNNGADHVFNFQAQLPDAKSIIGVWVEPAAPLADESKLVTKYNTKSPTVSRRLLQRSVKRNTVTRGMRPITINLTVAHDPEHTQAQIEPEILLLKDALQEAGFVVNFLNGFI